MFVGTLFLVGGLPPLLLVDSATFGEVTADFWVFASKIAAFFVLAAGIYGGLMGLLFVVLGFFGKRIPFSVLMPICLPILWAGMELPLRAFTFGFDWWLLGIPLIDSSVFRQLAVFGGVPFLSWFAATSGALLFFSVRGLKTNRLLAPIATLLFLAVGTSAGAYLEQKYNEAPEPSWPSIAVLQTNVQYPAVFPVEDDPTYGPMIREAIEKGAESIVVSGEISPRVVREENLTEAFWAKLLGDRLIQEDVLFIFYLPVRRSSGEINQTMFALRKGEVEGTYHKEILFPVSDYSPPGFLGVLFEGQRKEPLTPYVRENNLDRNGTLTADGLVGAMICNESFVPATAGRIQGQEARIIILSGSDRPFATDQIYNGTLRMAQLRAAQTRRWILRAQKTGISAIIAPNGAIKGRIERDEKGILYFNLK